MVYGTENATGRPSSTVPDVDAERITGGRVDEDGHRVGGR